MGISRGILSLRLGGSPLRQRSGKVSSHHEETTDGGWGGHFLMGATFFIGQTWCVSFNKEIFLLIDLRSCLVTAMELPSSHPSCYSSRYHVCIMIW